VARAVEDADPGLSHLRHPEHPGADQAGRKTEEMGGGEGLGAETILHPAPIPTDSADPGPDISVHYPSQRILFKELGALPFLRTNPDIGSSSWFEQQALHL